MLQLKINLFDNTLGIFNANYRFRMSDAQVFNTAELKVLIEDKSNGFPQPHLMPADDQKHGKLHPC